MSTSVVIPSAPNHMSDKAQKQWSNAYTKAFAQAKLDYPNNESTQRSAAFKAANALLAVTAPTSAAEIDKLEDWQVLLRETRTIKGEEVRFCVTADGRKYSFPVVSAAK